MKQTPTPFEALKMAVKRAGGQSAFAAICGVSQPAVWKWLHSMKRLPGKYALAVEAATGVAKEWLAPDFYPVETVALPASVIGEDIPLCGPILSARSRTGHGNRSPILDGEAA